MNVSLQHSLLKQYHTCSGDFDVTQNNLGMFQEFPPRPVHRHHKKSYFINLPSVMHRVITGLGSK